MVQSANFNPPAVSLRNFFDGDPDLVAEVSPSVHNTISAATQHYPVTGFIGVILILSQKKLKTHTSSNKNKQAK